MVEGGDVSDEADIRLFSAAISRIALASPRS